MIQNIAIYSKDKQHRKEYMVQNLFLLLLTQISINNTKAFNIVDQGFFIIQLLFTIVFLMHEFKYEWLTNASQKCKEQLQLSVNNIQNFLEQKDPERFDEFFPWLIREKYLVWNSVLECISINFNIQEISSNQVDKDILLENLLSSTTSTLILNHYLQALDKDQQKLKKSLEIDSNRFVQVNETQTLRLYLKQLFSKKDGESSYSTLRTMQHPNIQFNKYSVNIIKFQRGSQSLILTHFQENLQNNQSPQVALDLFKSISHELGTSLNCIKSLSSMAKLDIELPSNFIQSYIDPILINCELLDLFVNNLRDYCSASNNELYLQVSKFNIMEELEEILNNYQPMIDQRNIKIIVICESTIIHNDRDRFKQSQIRSDTHRTGSQRFRQSLKMSIYIEYLLETRVKEWYQQSSTLVYQTQEEQIILRNLLISGVLGRVSKNSVGCGIGLQTSNAIVRKLNGEELRIEFQSAPNVGSTFSFLISNFELRNSLKSFPQGSIRQNSHKSNSKKSLPISRFFSSIMQEEPFVKKAKSGDKIPRVTFALFGNEEHNYYSDESSSPNAFDVPKLNARFQESIMKYSLNSDCCSRVLLVDDEYFNMLALKLILKKYKSIIDMAFNGKEALDKIEAKLQSPCQNCGNRGYILIFLDVNMPVMDGIETVIEIKRRIKQGVLSKAICIANSGFSDLETKIQCSEAGMDYYFIKPLNIKDLYELIDYLFPPQGRE